MTATTDHGMTSKQRSNQVGFAEKLKDFSSLSLLFLDVLGSPDRVPLQELFAICSDLQSELWACWCKDLVSSQESMPVEIRFQQ